MISYEKIDCSEDIDLNKKEDSVKCMICSITLLKTLDLNINPMFVVDVMILV